jgi:hypothetical protein
MDALPYKVMKSALYFYSRAAPRDCSLFVCAAAIFTQYNTHESLLLLAAADEAASYVRLAALYFFWTGIYEFINC